MKIFVFSFLKILTVVVLASCSPLPQKQIDTFVETTAEAGEAGRQVYIALDQSVASAQSTPAGASRCQLRNGNASCFDPDLYLPAPARAISPDIEVRLLALDAINAYSAALLAIASGATQSQVNARIDQLALVTGKAATLLGGSVATTAASILGPPTVTAFKELATTIESVRGTAAARSTIVAEQDTVDALIDALIEDTSKAFDLYSTAQGKIASRVGSPLKPEFVEEQAKIGTYHLALQKYVALLAQTKISQAALVAAIVAPTGAFNSFDVALDQAIALRRSSEDFKNVIVNLTD